MGILCRTRSTPTQLRNYDAFFYTAMKILMKNMYEDWIINLKKRKNADGEQCDTGMQVYIYNRPNLDKRFLPLLGLVQRFVCFNGKVEKHCNFRKKEDMVGDEFMIVLQIIDLAAIPYFIKLSYKGAGALERRSRFPQRCFPQRKWGRCGP